MMDLEELDRRFSKREGNLLLDLYPLTKSLMALCVGVISIFSPVWWFGYCVSLLCGVLAAMCGRFKPYWKIFRHILFLFVFIVVLVQTLFLPGDHVLFHIGPAYFRMEGLLTGLNMTSVILAFSSPLILFHITTHVENLMIAIEEAGASNELSFLVLSSLQMIPEMNQKAKTIQNAQTSRGIETEGGVLVRLRALIPMLGPLLLSSIADAEEHSLALESRGFHYTADKTRVRVLHDSRAQKVCRVVLVAVTLLCCAGGAYLKWMT